MDLFHVARQRSLRRVLRLRKAGQASELSGGLTSSSARPTAGLVVMDHKVAGNSDGKVEEIVATWAPQLALYATAIARVIGKPPVGTLLNLPLEGSAVRVMGVK